MKFDKLYSRTRTGATQQWEIEVEENKYRTIEGQVGGKLTTSEWSECEGKSIGKKNETTPQEQALKEAQAKWEKKLEGNYWKNIEDVDKERFFKPMLAHKWEDFKDKITYPVFVQPKLDGIRCIITKGGMFSRNGKEITSCLHIFEEYKEVFESHPNFVFDGELYSHSLSEDFNKIISLVRKSKLTEKELEESKNAVEFHCYDMFDREDVGKLFEERTITISTTLQDFEFTRLVFTCMVSSEEEIELSHANFVEEGFEGIMIRKDAKYENNRSKSLLKKKDFKDDEFTIIDIEEGTGNRSSMMGRIRFKTKEGKEFSASSRGNMDYYRNLLQNKGEYIGKQATVRYQNLTPDGIPRFPVVIEIRDYE